MPESATDILIFGAGFGTRMAPLTETTPKPLIEVAGAPLIDHAIGLARDLALNIHVNAHYLAEQMVAHLPPTITTHVEYPDILDTGGGLKSALPKMHGEAVVTLNSDAVWSGPNPLGILLDAWRDDMSALLLLVPVEQTVGYARKGNFILGQDGSLSRSPDGQVYTGAQIIRRDVVAAHPGRVFSLNAVWDRLLGEGKVAGVTYPGRWADVGTPSGIPLAEAMLNV
ncbi:nucleotidyltransferase family protein [uncultured Litoreibacter sp.]|uniref:nucleotidyltransferase family protein n=1 Tax=uncultured Litoreibacter sp. TaxID=1392394 RepID=UPI0026029BAA|nr:nucleotidyltransferase family protein [uncultured Litoreibacter sp.]